MRIPAKYKGLTYLILLVVVMPIAGYLLALRKTVVKVNRLSAIENMIDSLRSNPVSSEEPMLEITSGEDIISNGSIINLVSGVVDRYGLSIEKFTIYTVHSDVNVKVAAAEMELAGDYKSMIRVIDFIERRITDCKISSVEFRLKKRDRQKTSYLSCTILLQQVIINQ